jgi:hypothetical protein
VLPKSLVALQEIVQNRSVSIDAIIIKLDDYTRKNGEARWRASWQHDYEGWLSQYFLPETPPIQKCPHGNGIGLDCTACHPFYIRWDGRRRVLNHPDCDLTGRRFWYQRMFWRKGFLRIDDHYVSPYDEHWRRSGVTEYAGGYFTAGYKDDGIGVRALKKHGPTDDDFEMRWAEFYVGGKPEPLRPRTGIFAVFPRPDEEPRGENAIELFRFFTSRATRVIPPVNWTPQPVVLAFEEENTAKLWRRDKPSYPPPPGAARPIPRGAPWPFEVKPEVVDPPHEWKRRKYGPAVGMKLKVPSGWYSATRKPREAWPDGWRTERKMRDIASKLRMHEYGGDGHINVPRMMATAQKNYREAWLAESEACGIQSRQSYWPGREPPRGSTDSCPTSGGPAALCYYKNPEQRLATSAG